MSVLSGMAGNNKPIEDTVRSAYVTIRQVQRALLWTYTHYSPQDLVQY